MFKYNNEWYNPPFVSIDPNERRFGAIVAGCEFCGHMLMEHDLHLNYAAHMEELESAVQSLLNGEDFEFTFDLTEYDKQYLGDRLNSILGPDFLLDFH